MSKALLSMIFVSLIFVSTTASAATYPSNGQISWKGQTWDVRSEYGEPGPCSFNPQGAFIDDAGRLHLTIQNVNGKWLCSEVDSSKKFSYGVYRWTIDTPNFQSWDKNIVGGPFTYLDDSHELDIEFSRWSYPNNNFIWFSNQPSAVKDFPAGSTPKIAQIDWNANRVIFSVWDSNGKLLGEATSNQKVPTVSSYLIMNLWLVEGKAPSDGKNVELIFSNFEINPSGNNPTNNSTDVTTPVADFSASPASGRALLNVQFTDASTGSPISWSWNFGDGTSSTARNPAHTYIKTGRYPVSLTVNNSAGSSTKTRYVTVYNRHTRHR